MTSNNPDASMPALIALGANIPSRAGTPAQTFNAALAALTRAGLKIKDVSPFYETEAWPNPGDPPFLNAVVAVYTRLQPVALMALLHQVETDFGRKRSVPNAPRELDLDLLDYAGLVHGGEVTLPHPRMAGRRFVLEPLRAVAPHWRHPVTGEPIDALLLKAR
jgi:2-amino-4-hydroxy-6-hydroxymethyldihydropteridine diphosphokinase